MECTIHDHCALADGCDKKALMGCFKPKKAETNGLAEYGKKLEALGKRFQDPETTLEDVAKDCFSLGLMISFRVEPDPAKSVDVEIEEE